MTETVSLGMAITGLGLFLYAMQQLETALEHLISGPVARWMRSATRTPLRCVGVGCLVTALMQSSSLVGLIVLALVSSRMLDLRQAMAIMLGANLGTTATGWLVTLLGFKLSLGSAGLPLAGVGALLSVLLPAGRWRSQGVLLFALGLLLFGLDTMKTATEGLAQAVDVTALQGHSPLVYLLVGVVVTAVIQSSSATMLIALTALNSQMISLHDGLALVIGADLGTTSTLLLGAIKGPRIKRQVALFHVIYNLATAILAFLLIMPLWPRVASWSGIEDPLILLVGFHSTFNALGIVVFVPLLGRMAAFIEARLPAANRPMLLEAVRPETLDAALELLTSACEKLVNNVRQLAQGFASRGNAEPFLQSYRDIRDEEIRLALAFQKLEQLPMSSLQAKRIQRLRLQISESVYAAKALKDVAEDFARLQHSRSARLAPVAARLRESVLAVFSEGGEVPDEASHHRAMTALHELAYRHLQAASDDGISLLNLAREVDECGRHWLRATRVSPP
ncbi:Na+/Picotransporter [Alcanivorax hongdengensis A-11-3]|uniref:Na+/Picotransporter n=1 Tax=Alcanivorax hongdengensis A-11-3 TaxID=1177179 RepID=L0WE22_9GAMM|nr:Na/Pi symporter [Alcanivorax hongdengensis]EKF75083.1 Na+/Picotransporter [Alcanivorax hongdengensis A-11-3]